MGRRKMEGVRVYGPHRHGRRWRVTICQDGERNVKSFITEIEATQAISELRKLATGRIPIGEALRRYETYMRLKGNKEKSIELVMHHLRAWLDDGIMIEEFDKMRFENIYKQRCKEKAVATHQRELGDMKTFFRWMEKEKLVRHSPVAEIKATGRCNRGKPQLRRAEAQSFVAVATELAKNGDRAALALLTILMLGLRASELLNRTVRDVDIANDGVLFWIEDGKTNNAVRQLSVPPLLASLLINYVQGKEKDEKLFSYTRTWLLYHCGRICKLAGVPVVPTHGLRGTWATLAVELGISSHAIARSLGHSSFEITRQHYVAPGTEERIRTKRVLELVDFGKTKENNETKSGKVQGNG